LNEKDPIEGTFMKKVLLCLAISSIAIPAEVKRSAAVKEQKAYANNLLFEGASSGKLDQVKEAIKLGAEINKINKKQPIYNLPLNIATAKNHHNVVEFLLNNNANPNQKDSLGFTALMIAAQGKKDIVQLLLKHGANTELKDLGRRTALDIAQQFGHDDIVAILKPLTNPRRAKIEGEEKRHQETMPKKKVVEYEFFIDEP